ncbi:hypothetical protein [Streptomyces sp. t39]|uniref:hypothetical protein n=1 Tax=Streptomyces sp. t39 TaxID=1828156 RepID=UPI0011CE8614|nr:hypothetical protein [Streptomyces sp. t39]TXS55228.1 hypothetical protein EAO77_02705 [Streptomyces sp. t39]
MTTTDSVLWPVAISAGAWGLGLIVVFRTAPAVAHATVRLVVAVRRAVRQQAVVVTAVVVLLGGPRA